jgi:hypothetical protein
MVQKTKRTREPQIPWWNEWNVHFSGVTTSISSGRLRKKRQDIHGMRAFFGKK